MRDIFDDESSEKGSSEFARMFEESMTGIGKKLSPGDKIRAEVLSLGKDEVFVSTGTVDDGVVLKSELVDKEGKLGVNIGDFIDLYVTRVQGGQVMLSPKPTAKNMAEDLEDAFDMMLPVEGRVTEPCNGGFRVSLMGKTAFCPISQMDLRRIDDPSAYIGKKFEFVITQFGERGRNIVVSRRKLLEEQKELSQAAFAEDHKVGDIVRGVVTRLEKYGAFIEIAAGLEGLCHISEVAWSRLSEPNEVLQVGQEVDAKILKIEEGSGRLNISLSIKQAGGEPWANMPAHIKAGEIVEGKVTRCVKFGAFVELAPGIEGLIPLSEMSYTKRVLRAEEIVKEGERVSVMIREIRPDDRRLSLSLKDAGGDPWAMVSYKFPEGSVAKGRVERREPYGIFVKLDDGIVGLLPKSKALENPDFPYEKVKIGDEVTVEIGDVKLDERRISLGVPQDPEAGAWKSFGGASAGGKSMGTLGEQFKALFDAQGKAEGKKKK
jgi:small subunit ribosomal protein S1